MNNLKFKIAGLFAAVCAAVCLVFAGCSLVNVDFEEVYNDDAKIATCNSSRRVGSVETSLNGEYRFSCMSLSGVYAMKTLTVSQTSSADLSIEVSGGKCKVVLIQGYDVYTLTEGSFDGAIDFGGFDGTYKLKIVGVDAHFSLKLKY